jgi:hypothetical protein
MTNLLGALPAIQIEEIAAVLSLLGLIAGGLIWVNAKQDNLVNRFNNINTRHLKLRGSLSLVFQKFSGRFTELDSRISNIELFLKSKGYQVREKEFRHEDYGNSFWNESGADDDTKIPE